MSRNISYMQHRHLAEADFRHNCRVRLEINYMQRIAGAVKDAEDKRLTYSADW